MPSVKGGIHGLAKHQRLYRDIHSFLKKREWAPIDPTNDTVGITWLELFTLYDTSGDRKVGCEHVKDQKAIERAKERRRQAGNKERPRSTRAREENAIVRPTLQEELKRFKYIVRQIAKHEFEGEEKHWFKSETRQRLGRLANLGIEGHQP